MAWNWSEGSRIVLRDILIACMYIALKLIEDQSLYECGCKLYIYGLVDYSSFI